MLTDDKRNEIRAALLSPDLRIGTGMGTATIPGKGTACTIAEINLVLTGRLTDEPHPCISDVIRRWVIRIQDAMPAEMRNAAPWREAAAGIAGSASTPEVEEARRDMLVRWMWDALADEAVIASLPESVEPAWNVMLREKTPAAAAAAVAAAAAANANADAAAYAAAAYANACSDADAAAYWTRRDPAALLARLIEVTA